MRCVIISMTCNTAVARCVANYTAARHLRTQAGQGLWRRVLCRLKHECQKIFQSQLLCFLVPLLKKLQVVINSLAYEYVNHEKDD